MKQPRRAVAGLLCVNNRILLVRRHVNAPAFPGYWACPGGKVEDNEAPPPARADFCGLESALVGALQRELHEELGIDIFELPCRVTRIGNALTPSSSPRRFDTDFFRIDFDAEPPITLDEHEHQEMRWASPRVFHDLYYRGELLCVAPLQRLLDALVEDFHVTSVPAIGKRPGQHCGLDLIEPINGLRMLPLRSNTLIPATHTNAFLLGDSADEHILVDPSPADEGVYQQLTNFLREWGQPTRIFLTHHHPDHHERAPQLARELNIPIALSAATHDNLTRRWGADYLDGIATPLIADGDVVCHTLGSPVRALSVPGHDNGHLALMPDSRQWMIVGDLYQGVGTVVIGKPEGNMRDYFASLRKVIALNPAVTVPSHGIAMPGVLQIQKTLSHRQQREDRIGQLRNNGLSIDEILASEYAAVPKALWPLARMNIEAHLEKIDAEA